MLWLATSQAYDSNFGVIVAAIIGAIGVVVAGLILIIVKKVKPAVGVKDMWEQINTQNRQISNQNNTILQLQNAVNELQKDAVTFRENQMGINHNLGEGFDALYGYVLRTTDTGSVPTFTPGEAYKINRARALRLEQINQPETYI